jgi:hypothetical protein
MASSPEELRGFRESYSVFYREVVKLHACDPGLVICFYEGKDSAFYRPRIEQWKVFRALPNGLEGFDCGGKKVVLDVRGAVDANRSLNNCLCLYFLDRDFDRAPSGHCRTDTYVSDGYSVEFHYFGVEFFSRVIQDAFFANRVLEAERNVFDQLLSIYLALEEGYLSAARPFNHWAYAVRARFDTPRVPFEPFDHGNFIQIDVDQLTVTMPGTVEEFEAMAPVVPSLGDHEWVLADAWLVNADPALDYRGKQHAWFILNLLETLGIMCRTGREPFLDKTKVSHRFSMKHFLADFSAFADTPASLLQFLNGFYEAKMRA